MHINVVRSGNEKQYTKLLLRKTYRRGSKCCKLTLANLSSWSAEDIAEMQTALKARRLDPFNPEIQGKILSMLVSHGCPVWKIIQEPPAPGPRLTYQQAKLKLAQSAS